MVASQYKSQANMYLAIVNIFENLPFHSLLLFVLTLLSITLYKWLKPSQRVLMPPSPPKLPIIGHLHLLGKLAHRNLRSLSLKYGDLMLLYLGSRPTLVMSSASAAEEIMKTHDIIFANRPNLRFIHKIFYNSNDVAFGSYGERWRRMRSICVLQLLSNKRVQSFRSTREEEVVQLLEQIKSYNGSVLNLSETLLMVFKGLICRTALGRKYNSNNESSKELYNFFKEFFAVIGEISVGDYIPYLGWIDKLTGLESRAENVQKRFDNFIEGVIQEHENRLNNTKQVNVDENLDNKGQRVEDFVDVLLEIQRENPEELSRVNIKAIILDMFLAGTETSSTTLEWAMTELLRHPTVMKKLQEEIRSIVKTNRRVTEDDLENMKYLKAVIKETLRLHPAAPLLLFRESSQKATIDKYNMSAKTQVIINAWAIQQDPKMWQNPEDFNPNRFLENSSSIDFRGHHFQFIPFGAGRRGCPGVAYGIANVEFFLASLVHEFNWTLPNAREGETLDVDERAGVTVGRQNPLMVIATPTPHIV